MITKTFICDKCKQSVGDDQLIRLTTSMSVPAPTNYNPKATTRINVEKDVCIECLKKAKVFKKDYDPNNVDVKQVKDDFQDAFVSILEEIGVRFEE